MSGVQDSAADVRGPQQGLVTVIATTTSSQSIDMNARFAATLGDRWIGNYCKLLADQTTYYFWSNDGLTAVNEATTGNAGLTSGMCSALIAGTPEHERPAGRYLVVKAASAGFLRVSLSQSPLGGLGIPRVP